MATILQNEILTNFAYPFLLIFFITFAILEKTALLGTGKKQLNAFLAGVISLIFVSAVTPKLIVSNMMLFLSVAIVIVFVVLLLWGFITHGETFKMTAGMKKGLAIVAILAVVIAIFWATGVGFGWLSFFGKIGSDVWSSLLFIVMIGVAIAVAIKSGAAKKE